MVVVERLTTINGYSKGSVNRMTVEWTNTENAVNDIRTYSGTSI